MSEPNLQRDPQPARHSAPDDAQPNTPIAAHHNGPEADALRLAVAWKLVTQDELRPLFDAAPPDNAATPILQRLLDARLITAGQAERLAREAAQTDLPAQQIPGYQLISTLGKGTMGVVYKARQLSMDRTVAVKVLRAALSKDPQYVERFVREAKLAAKLSHNHIVQAIDVGQAFGNWYFVMENVEGTTLGDLLDQKGQLEEREALRIVLQITEALVHAQKRGLVHRDIKPRNIMLTVDRVAKLADLGLARTTNDKHAQANEMGRAIGTPYYISPEQARGETNIDTRADIYSLGATLYHMVTGRPPFVHADPREVLKMHVRDELVPPDHINTQLSDGCGLVVERMLAKHRDERYPSPLDLKLDLDCLLAGKPPRLAQEHIATRRLEELADGETADEFPSARSRRKRVARSGIHPRWIALMIVLLGLSLLCNLFQWLQ